MCGVTGVKVGVPFVVGLDPCFATRSDVRCLFTPSDCGAGIGYC